MPRSFLDLSVFRFEWQFALGAMIANVHDIVLTIGFMSITQIDLTSQVLRRCSPSWLLLNDTVVIATYPRNAAPIPEAADAGIAQCIGESDLVALRYHARHGFAGPTGATAVRRAGDPQLHRNHDVWRRPGRHLYVGIYRFADPDLSWRRHRARFPQRIGSG